MAAKQLVIDIKLENAALKQELKRVNGQLDQLKSQANQASTSFSGLDGLLNKLTGTTGGLMGVVTKLGGAMAAAQAAGAIFNRMLETNQTLGDGVARVQQQVNSAMDYFASSLATMDFTNFINGLKSAIREGGKLADMLDDLNTYMQQLGVNNSKYNRDMAKLEKEYYSTNDPKKRAAITERMNQLGVEHRSDMSEAARKNRETGLQYLRTVAPGASDKQIEALVTGKNDAELKKQAERYQRMLNSKVTYQSYSPSAFGIAAPVSRYTPEAQRYMNSNQSKQDKIAYQLMNAQDEKSGQAAFDAREKVRAAYDLETQVLREETQVARKSTKTQAALDSQRQKLLKSGGGSGGKNTVPPPEGSLADYDKKIGDLKKKITFETDPANVVKIQKEIDDLTSKKETLQWQFNMALWESEHGKLQTKINAAPVVIPAKLEINQADMKKALDEIGKKVKKQLEEQLLNNLTKSTVAANRLSDGLSAGADFAGSLGDALGAAGGASNNVVQSFNMMGQVMSTLATMIPIIQALTMSEEQLAAAKAKGAIAGAAASAAQTPIIGWLMVGAAVAACIAALAAMGNYAGGGIIGGSNLVGDKVLARVNGGEMVLNKSQQANLFHLLDGTASLGGGPATVEWKIRGSDLYGVLQNYNRIKNRVRG